MAKPLALVLAALALLTPAFASATANYVYHEQTTSIVGGTCGTYVTHLTPTSAQSYPLELKIEYQFYTDNSVVYYTTDGSTPSGSMGVGGGTTVAVPAAYTCTFLDPLGSGLNDDAASATLPAQPAGTTVNYIVSAWHSGGGSEVFANSGTCGTCTPCTTSSCATLFTYTVTAAPDSGLDAGSMDAGTDAPGDAAGDAVVEANIDGGPDAGLDATLDAILDVTLLDATSEGTAPDGPGSDDAGGPPDAKLDSGPRVKDAAQGDTMREPSDAGFPFDAFDTDAGTSSSGASGCGCSTPGDTSSLAWGPATLFGALVVAAALRVRRR